MSVSEAVKREYLAEDYRKDMEEHIRLITEAGQKLRALQGEVRALMGLKEGTPIGVEGEINAILEILRTVVKKERKEINEYSKLIAGFED